MRYTEKKYDFEIDSKYDIIRMIFCSVFLSPYRLIKEVSSKVVFLDRKIFDKYLMTSCVVSLVVLVIVILYNFIFGFNWFSGGNCLLAPIISCSVVILIFLSSKNFSLGLSDLSPSIDDSINSMESVDDKDEKDADVSLEDELSAIDEVFKDDDDEELDIDNSSEYLEGIYSNDKDLDSIVNTLESNNYNSKNIVSKLDSSINIDKEEETETTDDFGIEAFLSAFEDMLDEDDDILSDSLDCLN